MLFSEHIYCLHLLPLFWLPSTQIPLPISLPSKPNMNSSPQRFPDHPAQRLTYASSTHVSLALCVWIYDILCDAGASSASPCTGAGTQGLTYMLGWAQSSWLISVYLTKLSDLIFIVYLIDLWSKVPIFKVKFQLLFFLRIHERGGSRVHRRWNFYLKTEGLFKIFLKLS